MVVHWRRQESRRRLGPGQAGDVTFVVCMTSTEHNAAQLTLVVSMRICGGAGEQNRRPSHTDVVPGVRPLARNTHAPALLSSHPLPLRSLRSCAMHQLFSSVPLLTNSPLQCPPSIMPGKTRHQAAPTPPRRSSRARRQTTYLHAMVSTDPMAQMTPDDTTPGPSAPLPNPRGTTVDSGEGSDFEEEKATKRSKRKAKGKAKREESDSAEEYLDVSWLAES